MQGMPKKKETLNTRVKRVETKHKDLAAQVKIIHADLAEQIKTDRAEWNRRAREWDRRAKETDEKVKILLDSQIKTDEQFRETRELLLESGEKVDERIAKLVSAIGELIRRMPVNQTAR
jgi:chaperonin cofactor prefoldin